jgi:hypothetical protein
MHVATCRCTYSLNNNRHATLSFYDFKKMTDGMTSLSALKLIDTLAKIQASAKTPDGVHRAIFAVKFSHETYQ